MGLKVGVGTGDEKMFRMREKDRWEEVENERMREAAGWERGFIDGRRGGMVVGEGERDDLVGEESEE